MNVANEHKIITPFPSKAHLGVLHNWFGTNATNKINGAYDGFNKAIAIQQAISPKATDMCDILFAEGLEARLQEETNSAKKTSILPIEALSTETLAADMRAPGISAMQKKSHLVELARTMYSAHATRHT